MACPEAALLDLGLQRTDQGIALRILDLIGKAEDVVERLDLLLHKKVDPVQFLLKFRIGFEIPRHDVSPFLIDPSLDRLIQGSRKWAIKDPAGPIGNLCHSNPI